MSVRTCVHTSVRPQKVYSISMKFGMYVQVDEWGTTVCSIARSKGKVTSPSMLEILRFQTLSPPPFTMGAGNWPLILKLGHNMKIWSGQIFYICRSFCATWLGTWQKRQLRRVDHQSRKGLIYFSVATSWCMWIWSIMDTECFTVTSGLSPSGKSSNWGG